MSLNFNFDISRDGALDKALAKDSLQRALDAAKHGRSKKMEEVPFLDMKNILYGAAGNIRTVAILRDTDLILVQLKWYSMCNVCLSHLKPKLLVVSSIAKMVIQVEYLDLFVLSVENLIDSLNSLSKAPVVSDYLFEDNLLIINLKTVLHGAYNRLIRRTKLDCAPGEWQIKKYRNSYYTMFKGDKYESLYQTADVTLSTDFSITAKYSSVVDAIQMYREAMCDEANIEDGLAPYLCRIGFASDNNYEDFSNIGITSPLKALTIRDQANTLFRIFENEQEDSLDSRESSLIVGKPI